VARQPGRFASPDSILQNLFSGYPARLIGKVKIHLDGNAVSQDVDRFA